MTPPWSAATRRTPVTSSRDNPPSVIPLGDPAGKRTVAVVLAGTVRSRVNPGWLGVDRCQSTTIDPRGVGTRPDAQPSALGGGVTANEAYPGAVGVTPRSVVWISTSTLDPHPCDMLSPLASEGCHTSQVNVAPRARMLAQPSDV